MYARLQRAFAHFAQHASEAAGSSWMFLGSIVACGIWVAVGPLCGWGELWHLIPTSILTWTTWVLVVLLQNSQIRQEDAVQKKLDELIKAIDTADNRLIGLEKQAPGDTGV
jgi:low affinity Fe/Cu permease